VFIMSLKPSVVASVPKATARVARAAFPKGNLYLSMRENLGTLFEDVDFTDLYPRRGQPAFAPWRLALITVMQFLENLSDRQTSEAVRSRIDWKYALSLELTDSGFDHSVLSHFRDRLVQSGRQELLLDRVLNLLREKQLIKERGKQRTDSTHVLAAIRLMNRLELVMETMRAALNDLSEAAPIWLSSIAPTEWFVRYAARIEDTRLPRTEKARAELAEAVGRDGFYLLERLREEQPDLLKRESVKILERVWLRHYTRDEAGEAHWIENAKLGPAAEAVESPYDTEARHSRKRDIVWTGYKVHLSETCDDDLPRLITNVRTTQATEQDVACTSGIHESLARKQLLPARHLVDTGYIDAGLLVESRQRYEIDLFGPPRLDPSWQKRAGGYDGGLFEIDWRRQKAICPEGKVSSYWHEYQSNERYPRTAVRVRFKKSDCLACPNRGKCVRNETGAPRSLTLPPKSMYQVLHETRQAIKSEAGRIEYRRRAGVEATISQGVRRGTMRRTRYRGLEKTHLQEVATATAINLLRVFDYRSGKQPAKTRKSKFARLSN
jgi:transposase